MIGLFDIIEKMAKLKRDPIKYIRDKAKASYEKEEACRICGESENLDFHHFYSLTLLFKKWLRDNRITIKTEEQVLEVRDRFILEHYKELYDEARTLCHTHHLKLHSIYGKNPSLGTAQKQKRWVEKQREKNGLN